MHMGKNLFKLGMIIVMTVFLFNVGIVRDADIKVYEIPRFADFSGPYADVTKLMTSTSNAIMDWWNDTEGKKLGIKIVIQAYDSRYDPATVAGLWPCLLYTSPS